MDGGRAAWTVLGLPTEGQVGDRRRVWKFVEPVSTVDITATIADVRALAARPPIVVINDHDIVLGLIEDTASRLPPDTPVERVMVPAPGTIRPDVRIDDALRQLRGDGLAYSLVTTTRGELVGMFRPDAVHA